jgi:hypothetical protein
VVYNAFVESWFETARVKASQENFLLFQAFSSLGMSKSSKFFLQSIRPNQLSINDNVIFG